MHDNYRIISYSHDHAASLAQMWNESDDQWPGTFTRGVPYTTQRIKEWMGSFDPLLNLIVLDDSNKVVAYGTLQDTANQSGISCYVPLLNVHPGYQGRSLCRRMLQMMVTHATDLGYQRMTIGTWPGNLKSVPLYKKVGFFWQPGADVGMENYTPLLLNHPATHAFFQRADWYRDFQRELAQQPDDQRHPATGTLPVYILRWEKDGDCVEAVVDRASQKLVGLETAVFSAHARPSQPDPAQGLRYSIEWTIGNKQATPLPVTLRACGDEGVCVEYETSFTLAPGESRTVAADYLCRDDAPPIDYDKKWRSLPRPAIHAQLQLGSTPLTLSCGLNYRPAIELSLDKATPTLLPNQPQPVLVQLHNRMERPLSGTLHLQASDTLQASWHNHPFTVPANDFAAVPLELCSQQPGSHPLPISATFVYDGQDVTTRLPETAVFSLPLGGIVATTIGQGQDHTLLVANDFYKAKVEAQGGQIKVRPSGGHADHVYLREELGPPHMPEDLAEQKYAMRYEASAGQVVATFTTDSTRFPGLRLTRTATFTASPLIQIGYRVENVGTESHRCYVQTRMGALDMDFDNAQVTIPRRERLVTALASDFMRYENDLPHQPEQMAEQWTALELDGEIHGIIWPADTTRHEIRYGGFNLTKETQELPPGAVVTFEPVYAYCGTGSWQAVQRAWQRLYGATATPRQPQPPLLVGFDSAALQTVANEFTVPLTLDNVQKLGLNGRLTLTPPLGWHASPSEIEVADLVAGQSITVPVQFRANDHAPEAASGSVHLADSLRDRVYPFTILRLGTAGDVAIRQEIGPDGKALWEMENGRFRWQVAPHYHGGLVGWFDRGSSTNHLVTLYPDPDGVFEGFKPWFGGVQPMLRRNMDDWYDWPGKFHSETFTAEPIAAAANGLPWQGVRVCSTPTRPGFEGLTATMDYLTLPGSPVLKLLFTVGNGTAVVKTAVPAFHTYLQPDGCYDHTTLHSTGGQQRKRNKQELWGWFGTWSAAENPDTNRTFILVSASGRKRTNWLDIGEYGGHCYVEDDMHLPPHSQQTLVAYLVLSDSLDTARQYATLSN